MTDETSDDAMTHEPRVVLVDDHAMFRAGVRAELGARVEVVGEAGTVGRGDRGDPRARARTSCCSTCTCPTAAGWRCSQAVGAELPDTRFLALSVSDAAEDVIAVIRAGARGYVTKTISADELADAIDRVADGDVVFSPRLAGFVLDAFRDAPGDAVGRPRARPADAARARGAAAARPRLRLQGDRGRAVHLGQDRRDARVERAAQAAAVQPPPADPLGRRPPHDC